MKYLFLKLWSVQFGVCVNVFFIFAFASHAHRLKSSFPSYHFASAQELPIGAINSFSLVSLEVKYACPTIEFRGLRLIEHFFSITWLLPITFFLKVFLYKSYSNLRFQNSLTLCLSLSGSLNCLHFLCLQLSITNLFTPYALHIFILQKFLFLLILFATLLEKYLVSLKPTLCTC